MCVLLFICNARLLHVCNGMGHVTEWPLSPVAATQQDFQLPSRRGILRLVEAVLPWGKLTWMWKTHGFSTSILV